MRWLRLAYFVLGVSSLHGLLVHARFREEEVIEADAGDPTFSLFTNEEFHLLERRNTEDAERGGVFGSDVSRTKSVSPPGHMHDTEPNDDIFWPDPNNFESEGGMNAHRRLIDDLLDSEFYETSVHPRRQFTEPTRINLSMSLYHLLHVDERRQTIEVNVWMVQEWYDEFIDWNPAQYDMINKTIVPHKHIWVPDTFLYNRWCSAVDSNSWSESPTPFSESLEQKRTESIMNAIITTGYWRNDSRGAAVQLMFPAIYVLSCHMNVKFFPYDEQANDGNCSFIISSWTRDSSTIDYHYKTEGVNLKNFGRNEEWEVISFTFTRVEEFFKCCSDHPWTMLYAHMVIRRKSLYYILNLVIPTCIITIVAVTGFFTPSSTSSERNEKLYLGINTLLTMMIMMLMVTHQMPSTSQYVPLLSWYLRYYMAIISVIVFGALLATVVLFIHSNKSIARPLPSWLRRIATNRTVWRLLHEPPSNLCELWSEYGVISVGTRLKSECPDPLLEKRAAKNSSSNNPVETLRSMASQVSATSVYDYEKRVARLTRQYSQRIRNQERKEKARRESVQEAAEFLAGVAPLHSNSRIVKRQKLMRRCSLEWEYLSNLLDRGFLILFSFVIAAFFLLLAFFDSMFNLYHH